MGFKKAICNDTFQGWDLSRVLRHVGELGYDGVEVAPWTLADSVEHVSPGERRCLREVAEAVGVEIIGLHAVTRGPAGIYLNHPDPDVQARTTEYLKALVDLCADLGGSIIVLGSAKHRNVLPGITPEEAWAYATETVGGVLDTAEERGVVLCLEPLSHRLTNFITKASEAVRMVEEIGHPHFKMMLDVRSASDDEAPIPDLICRSAAHLAHFHANDDNGRRPGAGSADYAGIAAALKAVGYCGYLSIEVFDFTSDPQSIAMESLAVLRRYFD